MPRRRRAHKCELCRKPFKTLQAKWGHYPHCPKRKLSQELASQARAEAPPSAPVDRELRRPGPDSQEMKLLLLETYEAITQLQRDAGHHVSWARFLASAQNQDHVTPEEWDNIYQGLGDVERDLYQMKGRLRLDRSLLFNIYHRMLAIQGAWLDYQARDFSREGEVTPQGEEVLREEQARFADLMLKIKRMLVAAR
jgi:hypothetical protein